MRVLIVEDEPSMGALLAQMVKHAVERYRSSGFSSGGPAS
ncbi:hypothetical protein Thivi_1314 [Thiocystis violascens DSM 198]|uniref:Uncharacterized protein n=1 Tax=Thiocystis violascens (strain ATCC 17096 / DSM 198 / 6111) TaxID=765911 RepID=I3Y8L0_THIV6|nr:hypothetical protein Thivi_1314 [Thiocystis violascens DSM 198]